MSVKNISPTGSHSYGISSIIATILILMIVIALAGSAYFFIGGIFIRRTAQSFSIIDAYENTIIIKNDGTANITGVTSITSDGDTVGYIMIPDELGSGEMGLVYMYTIKLGVHKVRICTASMCQQGSLNVVTENIAPNPGFEWDDAGSGPPTGWVQQSGSSSIVNDPHTGENALYFPGDGTYHRINSLYTIPLSEGQQFSGKLFYKSNGGQLLYFGINYQDGCGDGWTYFGTVTDNTNGQWKELSNTITIPVGKTCGHIWLFNYVGNTGPVWVDDVFITYS